MRTYAEPLSFSDILAKRERHVQRCRCGAWRWDTNVCPVCSTLTSQAVA